MLMHNWIKDHWSLKEYQDKKKKNFEIVNNFLDFIPHNILDIGCGLAWGTRFFQKRKYHIDTDVKIKNILIKDIKHVTAEIKFL